MSIEKYASFLKRDLQNFKFLSRDINRLYHRRLLTRDFNPRGIDIFSEDWDNMIILDACRYDLFKQNNHLPGRLERRTSRGASTPEFLKGNFDGRSFKDTVYVTANPQLYEKQGWINVTFHDTVEIWKQDGWDKKSGTVLPETTTKYALDAAKQYPNKRLIVHYLQPHYPFIDSETEFDKGHLENRKGKDNFWKQIMYGELNIDKETIWRVYRNNLKQTLPHIEELMNQITGKIIVTSDHGNAIGDRSFPIPTREWGHPRGVYLKELVQVPWLIHDDGERKSITADSPKSATKDVEQQVVEERLQSLGYKA